MKTSIILPIHNQADHLRTMVEGHLGQLALRNADAELILVGNACSDDSGDIARALESEHPIVRVIELEEGGWGRAVRAGLAAAQGELLCYSNSARTSPETLTLMLLYAEAYPDTVMKANRKIRESLVRRAGSLLYNLECRALFDLAVWDINGTPKVFPRKFDRLMELEREDDLIDLEFIRTCTNARYPIIEVPLLATHRYGGRSTTRYASAMKMYWGAYRMRNHAGEAERA